MMTTSAATPMPMTMGCEGAEAWLTTPEPSASLRRNDRTRLRSETGMALRAAFAARAAVLRSEMTAPARASIVLNEPVSDGSTPMGRGASSVAKEPAPSPTDEVTGTSPDARRMSCVPPRCGNLCAEAVAREASAKRWARRDAEVESAEGRAAGRAAGCEAERDAPAAGRGVPAAGRRPKLEWVAGWALRCAACCGAEL